MRLDRGRVQALLRDAGSPQDTARTLRLALYPSVLGPGRPADNDSVINLAERTFVGGWAVRVERRRPFGNWIEESPAPERVEDAVPPPRTQQACPRRRTKITSSPSNSLARMVNLFPMNSAKLSPQTERSSNGKQIVRVKSTNTALSKATARSSSQSSTKTHGRP